MHDKRDKKPIIEILQLHIVSGGRNDALPLPGIEIVPVVPAVTLRMRIDGKVIVAAATGKHVSEAIFNALREILAGEGLLDGGDISIKSYGITERYREGYPLAKACVVITRVFPNGERKETKGYAPHPDHACALCLAMADALNKRIAGEEQE